MEKSALKGRVALITGGATGIGKALTEGLLEVGAKVIIASRRNDLVHAIAAELNATHQNARVYPYVLDLRSREQADAVVRWALETLGPVDLLINNAGEGLFGAVSDIADEDWDRVMEINVRGAMYLIRQLLPSMLENNFGDIVNIGSQASHTGYADVPAYCASKHALLGLSRAVEAQVREANASVRVINICPSLVDLKQVGPDDQPADGTMHIRNMVQTLLFALNLDRNVHLGDINLIAR